MSLKEAQVFLPQSQDLEKKLDLKIESPFTLETSLVLFSNKEIFESYLHANKFSTDYQRSKEAIALEEYTDGYSARVTVKGINVADIFGGVGDGFGILFSQFGY